MKLNNKAIYFLSIPLVALTLWVGSIELRNFNSPKVLIATTGYDPRDLLSGHYLSLRLDWQKTNLENKKEIMHRFNYNYRFYLSENEAVYLDNIIRSRRDLDMKLEFSLPGVGEPLLRNLFIENKPWKDWVKEEKAKKK